MDALAMALHCVWVTSSFRDAVLKAANLRGDADIVAAITAQIAGPSLSAPSLPFCLSLSASLPQLPLCLCAALLPAPQPMLPALLTWCVCV